MVLTLRMHLLWQIRTHLYWEHSKEQLPGRGGTWHNQGIQRSLLHGSTSDISRKENSIHLRQTISKSCVHFHHGPLDKVHCVDTETDLTGPCTGKAGRNAGIFIFLSDLFIHFDSHGPGQKKSMWLSTKHTDTANPQSDEIRAARICVCIFAHNGDFNLCLYATGELALNLTKISLRLKHNKAKSDHYLLFAWMAVVLRCYIQWNFKSNKIMSLKHCSF